LLVNCDSATQALGAIRLEVKLMYFFTISLSDSDQLFLSYTIFLFQAENSSSKFLGISIRNNSYCTLVVLLNVKILLELSNISTVNFPGLL